MRREPHFTRLLLGLGLPVPDRACLRLASELAESLRLELAGLFLEDVNLELLEAHPAAREFQLLSRQWQALSSRRLAEELVRTKEAARRTLAELAEIAGVAGTFEVLRATSLAATASGWRMSDIVALAEAASAADRLAEPLAALAEAAFRSEASVLFLPIRIARFTGPVVALEGAPGDASLETATALAQLVRERLIVVRGEVVHAAAGTAPFRLALGQVRERLIVVPRLGWTAGIEASRRLAALRQVPVLNVAVRLPSREDRGEKAKEDEPRATPER